MSSVQEYQEHLSTEMRMAKNEWERYEEHAAKLYDQYTELLRSEKPEARHKAMRVLHESNYYARLAGEAMRRWSRLVDEENSIESARGQGRRA